MHFHYKCCVVVQFASQEDKRQKNERLHQHQKHENQMRDLQLQCDSNVRELQQLQVGTHVDLSNCKLQTGLTWNKFDINNM